MNPNMTPKISRVVALVNRLEAARMIMPAANAPAKDAVTTDNPEKNPVPTIVPPHIVAVAAPNDAPELTPIICGSASGFLNTLCICAPASASAAPASRAVATRGARRCMSTCALAPAPCTPPHIRSIAAQISVIPAAIIIMNMWPLLFIDAKLIQLFKIEQKSVYLNYIMNL